MKVACSRLKVLAPNKYEFYLSVAVVVLGVLATANTRPSFGDAMLLSCSLVIGLLCALNAVIDRRRMNWFEHGLTLVWFSTLLFFVPLLLWHNVLREAFHVPYGYYWTHSLLAR